MVDISTAPLHRIDCAGSEWYWIHNATRDLLGSLNKIVVEPEVMALGVEPIQMLVETQRPRT